MQEIEKQTIPLDQFAQLTDAIASSGHEAIILPGGAHEKMEGFLTCDRCGRFVCYKHNPDLKPIYLRGQREECVGIPSPEHEGWSRPIPERVIRKFTNQLVVTP